MSILSASLVVVVFAVLLERMHVASTAGRIADEAARSLRVFRDPSLDDEARARALRRNAIRLSGLSAAITGLSVIALLLPMGGVWVLDRAGLVSLSEVWTILQRVDFLIAATVAGTSAYCVSRVVTRG